MDISQSKDISFIEKVMINLFIKCIDKMIKKQYTDNFTDYVWKKIKDDKKLEILADMAFCKMKILQYNRKVLDVILVYTNNQKSCSIYLNCEIENGRIMIYQYKIKRKNLMCI